MLKVQAGEQHQVSLPIVHWDDDYIPDGQELLGYHLYVGNDRVAEIGIGVARFDIKEAILHNYLNHLHPHRDMVYPVRFPIDDPVKSWGPCFLEVSVHMTDTKQFDYSLCVVTLDISGVRGECTLDELNPNEIYLLDTFLFPEDEGLLAIDTDHPIAGFSICIEIS